MVTLRTTVVIAGSARAAFAAALIAVLSAGAACAGGQQVSAAGVGRAGGVGGKIEFSLTDLQGRTVRLADYRGKVVLIDFWATWCEPCMAGIAKIEAMRERFSGKGVEVLLVSIDEPQREPAVRAAVVGQGWKSRVLLDPDTAFADRVNPNRDMPFTLIVGRDGRVAWQHAGYQSGDELKIADRLEAVAADTGAAAPAATP